MFTYKRAGSVTAVYFCGEKIGFLTVRDDTYKAYTWFYHWLDDSYSTIHDASVALAGAYFLMKIDQYESLEWNSL